MRTLRIAAVAIAGVALIGTGVAGATSEPFEPAYVDAPVDEIPNAVAVADTGVIAASLHDARAVALIDSDGTVRNVELACSPHDVEIAPDGETAWAVCQSDTHLHVIDVASGTWAVADMDATGLDAVNYLPDVDRLLIASMDEDGGQIISVDATPGSYGVLNRVVSNERFTQLAPFADGTRTYALTDGGTVLYVDIEMGGQIVEVREQSADRITGSIALSPAETALYAVSIEYADPANVRTSVERIDSYGGATLQSIPLDMTMPGATQVGIAANARSVFVSSGLGVRIGQSESGLVRLPADKHGRLGEPTSPGISPANGAAVATSSAGTRVAFGTLSSTVIGMGVDGSAYPKAIAITAKVKGKKLTITGTTVSLPPMTALTVHVKDLTRAKATFVKQGKSAYVDRTGRVIWKGKAPSQRFALYLSGGGAKSATVKVKAGR